MPRITSRRVETPELQGEGSYVIFRRISWKLAKDARKFILLGDVKLREDLTPKQVEKTLAEEERLTSDAVLNGIIGWNWQDENGKDIPIPKKMEDLDTLTADEVAFLIMQCTATYSPDQLKETEAKN